MDNKSIKIKGKSPQKIYTNSLSNIFNSLDGKKFTIEECLNILNNNLLIIDHIALLQHLFDYRKFGPYFSKRAVFSFAGPFQMKDIGNFFQYNLQHQDTVIKIELEKIEGLDHEEREIILERLFSIISVILRTKFFNSSPLYLELTNIELDSIVLKCFSLVIAEKQDNTLLINIGEKANEISHAVLQEIYCTDKIIPQIEEILPFVIYSGVIWWSDLQIQENFRNDPSNIVAELKKELINHTKINLGINDFSFFSEEVLRAETPKRILYFLDDNGELIWNLLFINLILEANPNISVKIVINNIPTSNNANKATLFYCLEEFKLFSRLIKNKRFSFFFESNKLSSIDLRFISCDLTTAIENADIIFVNGVSFFEKLQYLPVPTYYMFTVYSYLSTILTGFDRDEGIFARMAPHSCCFSCITYKDNILSAKLNFKFLNKSYKEVKKEFKNESEAYLFLQKIIEKR